MNNLTKFKICKPAHAVFEAFVDPSSIQNFWFSSSSARWEQGTMVTLRYDEYNAQLDIKVIEVVKNEKIVFKWGPSEEEHLVTIALKELDDTSTLVEVNEEGFEESDGELLHKLLDNKEGWVFMLTCLKAYLEFGVSKLKTGLVKG